MDAQICPDLVLAGIAALGAAALLAMYLAATQNANGKRKRRRSLEGNASFVMPELPYVILVGNNSKMT